MQGVTPEFLMQLQALGAMQGMPGLGAMPQMANAAMVPGGPVMAGPPLPAEMSMPRPDPLPPQAGPLGGDSKGQRFPINAATLAALGAAAGGLQAGAPPRPPMAGTPQVAARAPGGFSPVYNRLPGRG